MPEGESILIIEDDDDLRDSLFELISLKGYKVEAVANGREALERLADVPVPCLIILDLMLPVISGWEFRRQQLSDPRLSKIPTVILSGIGNLETESRRLRAIACVSKPIDFDLLFKTIDEYC